MEDPEEFKQQMFTLTEVINFDLFPPKLFNKPPPATQKTYF